MKKRRNMQSASIRTRASLARMATPPDSSQSSKMTNVKALLASGQPIAAETVFQAHELEPHGDPLQKGFHSVGAPLSRWRLIASALCVQGEVHKADGGGAAGDSDTNFELVIPKFAATGALSDEAKKINQKIDAINQEQNKTFEHIDVFSQNNHPQDPGRIFIHCEVDRNRLADLKPDLEGMMVGDCYEICGQLVMDTFHGGLYEIHPVTIIDRC
jgi:hypothetical protein